MDELEKLEKLEEREKQIDAHYQRIFALCEGDEIALTQAESQWQAEIQYIWWLRKEEERKRREAERNRPR
jgi:dTDP-4-amino-4,6-dideoxygalactose transaminase